MPPLHQSKPPCVLPSPLLRFLFVLLRGLYVLVQVQSVDGYTHAALDLFRLGRWKGYRGKAAAPKIAAWELWAPFDVESDVSSSILPGKPDMPLQEGTLLIRCMYLHSESARNAVFYACV